MAIRRHSPRVIIENFKYRWSGTDEQLHKCIWDLIDDLLDSVNEARQNGSDEYATVQDYVANHYEEI